ncbi:MAG: hypothetical protein NZ840_10750 [Anaerolineales bacterium]|nr:hypothetical protein [Anaerolineales bacterium]MDW8162516.1 hypothetical protein [Anaerolineales bacterium]
MSGLKDLPKVWQSIKEIDLRPIREEALQAVHLAIAGRPDAPKQELAWQMRRDPYRPSEQTFTPISILDYTGDDSALEPALNSDLLTLILPAATEETTLEQKLVQKWMNSGRRLLVLVPQDQRLGLDAIQSFRLSIGNLRPLFGDLSDPDFLLSRFVPAVLEALPQKQVALARQFPLFRDAVARQLIAEGCFTNAAYAFSTGLAEIVPGLNIPLNVADMVVLTKNQAFLAYRLGLALGFSTRWQDYLAEFGGILGSGFLWRQLARQLVGLIPAWGIVPKVAVAYAGTYVVGRVILQWYLTGKKLSPQQMRQLYGEAFQAGKAWASKMLQKIPRPRLPQQKRKPRELPLPPESNPQGKVCSVCGRSNDWDARYCQSCGTLLERIPHEES